MSPVVALSGGSQGVEFTSAFGRAAEVGENMSGHPSRRQILRSTLTSSGLGLAIGYPALTFAQSAAPTPQCHDADEATIRQTEGPYFKRSSPQRADIIEAAAK